MSDTKVGDDYLYQSRRGRTTGWLILTAGMIIPGSALLIDPSRWTTTHDLSAAFGFAPWVVAVLGAALLIAGLASLFFRSKTKDVPYVVGIVFYSVIELTNVVNFLQGTPVEAMFLVAPLLIIWVYYLGTLWTTQRRERRLRDLEGD